MATAGVSSILVAMSRPPRIPVELTTGPFTLEQARLAGLTPRQLRSSCWTRIGPARYVWAGLDPSERHRLQELMSRLPGTAIFCGLTAGALHGLEVKPAMRPQILVGDGLGVSDRLAADVHRAQWEAEEIEIMDGFKVTTVPRTIVDIGRWTSITEGVVAADRALHRGLIDIAELDDLAQRWKRRKGVRRLRRVIELCDPASESSMETRLRLLLVLTGLPPPLSQVELRSSTGQFLARVDFLYPDSQLVIEYDGGTHRDSVEEDNRRQNLIVDAGYRVLRFASRDVYVQPQATVAQVRRAIRC